MSSPTADGALVRGLEADIARRARLYEAWQAHSRRIHFFRKLLPVLIGLVLLTLIGWTVYNAFAWRLVDSEQEKLSIRLVNAKFYGRTSDDSPYVISAASAVRDERDFQRVVLDRPVFIQDAGLPTETQLRGRSGEYREDTLVLRLENDVVLQDKRGYEFEADRAVIDTRAGVVTGESPIDGAGPLGQIAASSYSVHDGGDRIVFRGGVRSRIIQSGGR